MKLCFRSNKGKPGGSKSRSGNSHEEEESEGLALLMADIQHTAGIVQASTSRLKARTSDSMGGDHENDTPMSPVHHGHNSSIDKLYITVMKDLQFGECKNYFTESHCLFRKMCLCSP